MSLRAERLRCVRGARCLFEDISFALAPGAALQVTGANGAGKTSLLRMLCGLSRPDSGAVYWEGRDIAAARSRFCADLFYLAHADAVKPDLCAWENLVFDARLHGVALSREQACASLAQLGLGEEVFRPARQLSQGQRKRVALAALRLPGRARLWILDEPFAALDADALACLHAAMTAHCGRGGSLVYTTHQEVGFGAARLHLAGGRAC